MRLGTAENILQQQRKLVCVVLLCQMNIVLSLSCFEDNGYVLQASATSTVPLTADGLRSVRACSNQCMADPCCLSFGIKDGQCETAVFKSHDLDFVKQGSCTGSCPSVETCTVGKCAGEYGANGGEPYNFFPEFAATRDEVTSVVLTSAIYNNVEFINGIGMTIGSASRFVTLTQTPPANTYECSLSPGEYITEASMYEALLFGSFPVQSGLKFVTSQKVCGPYGESSGTERTFRGNKLMYMHGRLGMAFDKFAFVFDKCTA